MDFDILYTCFDQVFIEKEDDNHKLSSSFHYKDKDFQYIKSHSHEFDLAQLCNILLIYDLAMNYKNYGNAFYSEYRHQKRVSFVYSHIRNKLHQDNNSGIGVGGGGIGIGIGGGGIGIGGGIVAGADSLWPMDFNTCPTIYPYLKPLDPEEYSQKYSPLKENNISQSFKKHENKNTKIPLKKKTIFEDSEPGVVVPISSHLSTDVNGNLDPPVNCFNNFLKNLLTTMNNKNGSTSEIFNGLSDNFNSYVESLNNLYNTTNAGIEQNEQIGQNEQNGQNEQKSNYKVEI